jgi:hypothetical protein
VSLSAGWQHIKGGRPGRRFQDHYDSMHLARRGVRRRIQSTLIALVLIAAGVALGFVPGIPGVILVFLGAAYISSQSRAVARALD